MMTKRFFEGGLDRRIQLLLVVLVAAAVVETGAMGTPMPGRATTTARSLQLRKSRMIRLRGRRWRPELKGSLPSLLLLKA